MRVCARAQYVGYNFAFACVRHEDGEGGNRLCLSDVNLVSPRLSALLKSEYGRNKVVPKKKKCFSAHREEKLGEVRALDRLGMVGRDGKV